MSTRFSLGLFLAMLGMTAGAGCSHMQCGDGCRTGSPYAGMKYECCCETCGPNCGPDCGEHACGCADEHACGCAAEDACGCATEATCAVECGNQCSKSRSSGLFRRGCNGCGELYWSEWFNDPPTCCEPCDCHGNYIGPGDTGYFQAPYMHHSAYAESAPTALPPLEVAPMEEAPLEAEPPVVEQPADLVNPLAGEAE